MRLKRIMQVAAALGFAICVSASGSVMMIDFGPTVVTSAANLTNSPYHTANGSFTGTSWNTIGTSDSSSLVWSDGTAATGVSLNLGGSTGTTLTLGTQPSSSSALGGGYSTGIYATDSAERDGIFHGTSTTSIRYIGFQVGGLTAGTYDIYLTGLNTSLTTANTVTYWYGISSVAGDFNFSSYTTETLDYPVVASANTSTWVDGVNYVKFTVTLAAGQYLNVADRTTYAATGESRGFLNSVQIVAIPEPAAMGMLVFGAVAMFGLRRLRNK